MICGSRQPAGALARTGSESGHVKLRQLYHNIHPLFSSLLTLPPSTASQTTANTMSLSPAASATFPVAQSGAGAPIEAMFKQILDAVQKSVSVPARVVVADGIC